MFSPAMQRRREPRRREKRKGMVGMSFEASIGSCSSSMNVVSIPEGDRVGSESVVDSKQGRADDVPYERDS